MVYILVHRVFVLVFCLSRSLASSALMFSCTAGVFQVVLSYFALSNFLLLSLYCNVRDESMILLCKGTYVLYMYYLT